MTKESQEIAEARARILDYTTDRWAWLNPRLDELVEAVRKDERERIFGVPDEERAKWGHGLNGLIGDY